MRPPPVENSKLVTQIKISAVFHVSSRCDSRSHAATRVIRRKVR